MPDIKHNFTGGKMNKDLNERLVPNGEYREAMNIQVQTSEGSDVGTIQNILGNNLGCDYSDVNWDNPIPGGSTTVGSVSDEKNDSLYWLISGNNDSTATNWTTVTTVKDLIMRTNPSNITGCEPVFVDTYGFSTVNLETSDVNALNITGSLIDQLDYGYTVTGITASGDTSNTATVISFYSGQTYDLEWELVPTTTGPTTSAPFCMAGASPMCNCTGMNLLGGAVFSGGWSYFTTNKLYLSGCSGVNPADWIGGNMTLFAGTVDEQTFTITNAQNVSVDFASGVGQNMVEITLDSNILDVSGNLATGLVFNASGLINSITGSSTSGGSSMTSQFLGNPMGATGTITIPPTVVSAPSGWINIPIPSDPGGYDVNNFIVGDSISISMFWGGASTTYCVCSIGSSATSGNAIQIATPDPSNPGSCLSDCGLVAAPFVNTGISYWVVDGTFTIGDEIFANLDTTINLSSDTYTSLIWEGPRVLNFNHGNLITGINIVDDMLFWTDGYHDANNKILGTEPKKININRSIQGTNVAGATHTDLYVDGINEGPIREKHITVIRKAPLGPPTLEMSDQVREGLLNGVDIILSNTDSPTQTPFLGKVEGDSLWVTIDKVGPQHPNFEIGDILRSQGVEPGVDFNLPSGYHLRLEVIEKQAGPFSDPISTVNATVDQTAYLVRILNITEQSPSSTATEWYTGIEEGDSLFERKFPRFAYRYKYVDNEYSSFGPFSEVAFIPREFDYAPIEAYNIGMTNKVKSLIIKDFVSNDTPKDVVQVDILYKNETSPTVYLLDSIYRYDDTDHWNTSSYEVSTESVFGALPTSQTLRSWDNVPRKATSQEVTGNRIVYGNYLQGYDIKQNQYDLSLITPSITTSLASRAVDSSDYTGKKSIKSLRTYDVGVVWGDKYGRETPVITSTGSSLTVPKGKSLDSSYLVADIGASPHWADYYRFYVKETSNEYYNMPVDRVYDAEDGNIWVSFPSVDRNKVDEDTYIVLKKGINSNELILEDARYKIVAIENEAPEYIKSTYERLARSNTDNSRHPHGCLMFSGTHATPLECEFAPGENAPTVGRKGFSLRKDMWGDTYSTGGPYAMALPSPKVLLDEVKENSGSSSADELFVSFSKEVTDGTGTTIISSRKYHVTDIVVGSTNFYIDLSSQIVSDDGWVAPYKDNYPGITGAEAGMDDNIHIHFWKKTIRNKPEFDGRFFVKILNDGSAINNLKSTVGSIRNFSISASTALYKIEDPILSSPTTLNNFSFSNGNGTSPVSTHTRTSSDWNNRLKFGGSGATSNWFIDKACFSSFVPNGSSQEVYDFDNGTYNVWALDLTSLLTDTFTIWCGNVAQYNQESESLNLGTGAGTGRVGMRGIHEFGGAEYFDLGYSKTSSWDAEDVGEEGVVSGLKLNKRFRLDGSEVIYKILGITKFRLRNYQGALTANSWHTNPSSGVNGIDNFLCTGDSSSVQLPFQKNRYNDNRNIRVTYRIKYEVDLVASPDGTTVTRIDDPSEPYHLITNSDSVRIDFLEEFTVEGENPISTNPAIFETEPKEDVDLDLYYEASSSLTTFPITEKNKLSYIPMGAIIIPPPLGSSIVVFPQGVFITGWEPIDPISPSYTINLSTPITTTQYSFLSSQPYLVLEKDNGEIIQAEIISGPMVSGLVVAININPISRIGLNWFNCWSFNNGVESNRVGDTFNKPFLTNGAIVSTTTEERFKEEHRKYGLIYSGLYNSNSGMNSLNQFIQAEKITKDINPTYGSIQKLHSGWGQGGDLVALCEDRVLKILANKDALFNADGNSNVTSTNNVLGQAIPYSGEFGISKNPESFASDAYRAYFTDKVRGTVMRLSMDGLTPISEHGMKDWFRDNLKLGGKIIGSYDDRQDEYNVNIIDNSDGVVSFSERVKGWVSFKSFSEMENGISCANDYYTFKNGNLYKHHDETVNRNTFYPYESSQTVIAGNYTDSSFTVLINESPGTVKTFHTLNYEGSQSKIDVLNSYQMYIPGTIDPTTGIGVIDPNNPTPTNDREYYNINGKQGWYVQSITTDLEQGSLNEFIEKEGKWFNYIKGTPGSITDGSNIEGFGSSDISFQGLGRLQFAPTTSPIEGCTDDAILTHINWSYNYPSSINYDPNALVDDGSCVDTEPGCTDPNADANYDPDHNWDAYANLGYYVGGACKYYGCTDDGTNPTFTGRPIDAVGPALNYDSNANIDDGSCTYPIYGCMLTQSFSAVDPYTGLFYNYDYYNNYDITATTPCDGTVGPPCVPFTYGNSIQTGANCCCTGYWAGCMQCGTIWEDANAQFCPGGPATTPGATNFDPMATAQPSPGYCTFPPVLGCIDSTACNYDPAADTDDGSCVYCGDTTTFNVNNYDGADPSCTAGCLYCAEPQNFITDILYPDYVTSQWVETYSMPGNAVVDSYRLRYRVTGTTTWSTIFNIAVGGGASGISHDIVGLDPNVTYDIELKAKCSNSDSGWITSTLTPTATTAHLLGCTDPGSVNYDGSATQDDGSCVPCNYGCMNEFAADGVTQNSNYDALATCDDNSCTPCVYGCIDPTACNYDPNATCDDFSCFLCLPATINVVNVTGTFITQAAGIANTEVTVLFSGANPDNSIRHRLRYRETGTGPWTVEPDFLYSSVGNIVIGDVFYANTDYDFQIKTVCNTSGCNTGWVTPFQVSNIGPNYGCTDDGTDPSFPGRPVAYSGAADNYNPLATDDDGGCLYTITGCQNPAADNYDPTATSGGFTTNCTFSFPSGGLGCTDGVNPVTNYNPLATIDDGSCMVIAYGCTTPTASNYNATVNTNDGSCIWFGCLDPLATNFDPIVTVDDGSCTY